MQSIAPASPTSSTNGGLTLQDSLSLLTSQLQNQDPLSPTDSSQFATQIEQINADQSLNQISSTLQSMAASQQITEASALIGKTVSFTDANGQPTSGTVASVTVANGVPELTVNGQPLALSSITGIQ